jgi:hypothetical protein
MSKRLQVVVRDEELERFARTADSAGLTLSEWARQALRAADRTQSSGDVEAKLAVIREAVGYETGGREVDIEDMIAQSEDAQSGDPDSAIGDAAET